MPDQGWSMLPVGSKRALYQEYDIDVEKYKDLYLPCNEDYFVKTWSANFRKSDYENIAVSPSVTSALK